MNLFKHTNYQRVYETSVSFVVVLSLFATAVTPQVLNAASPKGIISAAAIMVVPTEPENKSVSLSLPDGGEREALQKRRMRVSFYSSDVGQTDDTPCIPADGSDLCLMAEEGIVDAVATNQFSLGRVIRIPELEMDGVSYADRVFVNRDRMNARYNNGNYIDIYIAVLDENGKYDPAASRQKAKRLGVKYLDVEVF